MKLSPSALIEHARSAEGQKQLRYAGVSVVFVPLGQGIVQLLGGRIGFAQAGLVAALILTLPNFYANKRLVWRLTSKENQRTQILVFWVAATLGVLFSTSLTLLLEQVTGDEKGLLVRLAVFAAQLTGYGIVWVARFLVLDRWLFKITQGREPTPEEADELHTEIPM
jgi:putative flippase GtrA